MRKKFNPKHTFSQWIIIWIMLLCMFSTSFFLQEYHKSHKFSFSLVELFRSLFPFPSLYLWQMLQPLDSTDVSSASRNPKMTVEIAL